MKFHSLFVPALAAGFALLQVCGQCADQPADPAQLKIKMEALNRMDPEQVNSNPKLKAALDQVLEAGRGTPEFVRLVQKFQVKGHEEALLDFAQKHPGEEPGVVAMRLVLANNATEPVKRALSGPLALATAEALGNSNHKRAVPLLLDLLRDPPRDAALRQQAVRSLAQIQDGAAELLKLARENQLAAELKPVAAAALKDARWTPIRDEAAKMFTSTAAPAAEILPPVAELLQLKGDAANGAKIFRRETSGCINCHQINGEGKDFGPALSEIGTKLGKDALYQAILEPSAGISFGFEAWQIELKNGEEAYGIIVSETENELTLKDARAIPTTLKKSDIAQRTQSKLSIMPAGMQQVMSTQELVDLVEYLSTLKKK